MDDEPLEVRDKRLQELWEQLDTKKKGTLDYAALKNGLVRMNHPLKDAEPMIQQMLSACDINRNGKITFDEFARFCTQTEQELWSLFNAIDKDKNGKLDKKELSVAFDRAGVAVSNARLDRFFQHIDRNHDGAIDFAEWRDFLLFIPTNAPSIKAVFSYYASTVKLSSEGDVFLSEEALTGLGTTLHFLKSSMFGALGLIVERPSHLASLPSAADADHPLISELSPTAPSGDHTSPQLRLPDKKPYTLDVEDDSFISLPSSSARPKKELRLTDFVPDVGYFIAGGLSGITSRTTTAPLDRLKVYLIAQTGTAQDAVDAAKRGNAIQAIRHGMASLWKASNELWAAGGVRSLFAGNGLNVVKVMPESAVKFGSYEASKRAVARLEGHDNPKQISSLSQFTAGGVAGMISQAVVYPLDTLKFRMQCETVAGGVHGNRLIIDTMKKMWAHNGIVSFYRGLPMGLIGMFPYAAIDLFTFESLKKALVARNMRLYNIKHEEDALPNNFALAIMGGFSGAIGASAVYPLNLLRTRLQSQGTAAHPRTYTGIMDVTRQTLKGEGVRGLFKGLTPNLLKVVPAVSITYVVYENTKKALHLH